METLSNSGLTKTMEVSPCMQPGVVALSNVLQVNGNGDELRHC